MIVKLKDDIISMTDDIEEPSPIIIPISSIPGETFHEHRQRCYHCRRPKIDRLCIIGDKLLREAAEKLADVV
jgi:hypothetical protein